MNNMTTRLLTNTNNHTHFSSVFSNIFAELMTTEAESFDRTFSKVREFLRQSLKSTSAEVEILPVLQTDDAPSVVWKE